MIQRIGDWIITNALFRPEGEEKLEEMGIHGREDNREPSPIRFRLSCLESYNEGSKYRPTTILLKSSDLYSIDVPFKEFDEFILSQKV